MKELIAQREFSLFLVLVLACIFMSSMSPVFFTWANAEAMLLALSVDAIIAVGMVVLLISGGLDLSIGSTLGLTGVVTGSGVECRAAGLGGHSAGVGDGDAGGPWQRSAGGTPEDQPVYHHPGHANDDPRLAAGAGQRQSRFEPARILHSDWTGTAVLEFSIPSISCWCW